MCEWRRLVEGEELGTVECYDRSGVLEGVELGMWLDWQKTVQTPFLEVFRSAIVIDVIVHCHTAGAL